MSESIEATILEIQRFVASESIWNMGNYSVEAVLNKLPNEALAFQSQILADYKSAHTAIKSSANPLTIATDFHAQCIAKLKAMGIVFLI